jgi:hypothetical protein
MSGAEQRLVHAPCEQFSPAAQLVPHAPQFEAADFRSTQRLAAPPSSGVPPSASAGQTVRPEPQPSVQAPFEQTSPAAQAVPQAPQFCESTFESTQPPPHETFEPSQPGDEASD